MKLILALLLFGMILHRWSATRRSDLLFFWSLFCYSAAFMVFLIWPALAFWIPSLIPWLSNALAP